MAKGPEKKKMQMKRFLFLDRDGVLNRRLPGDYVKSPEELELLPGVLRALALLRPLFDLILVVSNQQGVGKGLMSTEDLERIHRKLCDEIARAGGRIDDILFCPDLAGESGNCRKPAIAMALEARKRYPQIRFDRSWMIGDMPDDMAFARNAGMRAVMIGAESLPPELESYHRGRYPALIDFAIEFSIEVDKNHNTQA